MKRSALLAAPLCFALALCVGGCSVNAKTPDSSAQQSETTGEADTTADAIEDAVVSAAQDMADKTNKVAEKSKGAIEEALKPDLLTVGDTISNEQFTITLTGARVDNTLSSIQSSTYWEPADGGAFVILEFDVTALTSDKIAIDDYVITDLVANYNEDVYQGWTMSYLSGELWLYYFHTYQEANLPNHIYVYTTIPADALSGGSVSVDLNLVGHGYTIAIQ